MVNNVLEELQLFGESGLLLLQDGDKWKRRVRNDFDCFRLW